LLTQLKNIRQNEFFRNVFTLFSGAFIAQLIPFAITPILTRLYPKDVFALFILYSAAAAIPQVISNLRYEIAIVLPKRDKDAFNLLIASLLITIMVSLVIFILIIIFYNPILNFFQDKALGKWLYLIPVSVLFQGIFQALSYWNNRKKEYKAISISRVNKSVASSITQLVPGFFNSLKTYGLIGGMLVGQLIQAGTYIYSVFRKYNHMFKLLSWKKMWYLLKKYKDMPLLNTIISLTNQLSSQLPVLLLTRYFGVVTAGYYGLSNRIVTQPMSIIEQSFMQVFYQNATDIFNSGKDLFAFVKKSYIRLFKVAIIPYLTMLVFAPLFFRILFTEEYREAGVYTQILVPWLILTFMNSPITVIVTILNKQKEQLGLNIISLLSKFAALYIGYHLFNSVMTSLILFSATGFVYNICGMFYYFHISKKVKVAGSKLKANIDISDETNVS
jgi:lipopolysaccharide exporter